MRGGSDGFEEWTKMMTISDYRFYQRNDKSIATNVAQ